MAWQVKAAWGGPVLAEHKTKKAATAAAKEMQDAHEQIEARHNGEPVTFAVEKVDQEPVAEEAPVEEE
jgi:hypothetical protein